MITAFSIAFATLIVMRESERYVARRRIALFQEWCKNQRIWFNER